MASSFCFIRQAKSALLLWSRDDFKNYLNLSLYPGREATWSPDGSQVAFIGKDSDGRRTSEIFILDVGTGKMEQMTSTTYDYFDLHWR